MVSSSWWRRFATWFTHLRNRPNRVPDPVRAVGSILIRPQHGDARRAVVTGAAHGLERDERRLAVVVPDVKLVVERVSRSRRAPDCTGEHPQHVPEPAGFVLAFGVRGHLDVLGPHGPRE